MISNKYRKRPVVVEAAQWDGTVEDATEIINWVLANGGTARYVDYAVATPPYIAVETPDATGRVFMADWVIKGVAGDFYPCKPLIFIDTYEAADE